MNNRVPLQHLLSSAEECSRQKEKWQSAVHYLCRLKTELDVTPYGFGMEPVVECLTPFLRHEYVALVKVALSALLSAYTLLEKTSDLPQDLLLEGLIHIAHILSVTRSHETIEIALHILSVIPVGQQDLQNLTRTSSCLHHSLVLFSKLDLKCVRNNFVNKLTSAINGALILPLNQVNQLEAGSIVVTKVITVLSQWTNSVKPSVSSHCIRDVLVLCQNVIHANATNKFLFLQSKGIDLLTCILQEKEHTVLTKSLVFKVSSVANTAQCLLTSITWLFDAVVTHYKPACLSAVHCGSVDTLLQFLKPGISQPSQAGVISAVAHIAEWGGFNIPSSTLKTLYDKSLQLECELSPAVMQFIKQLQGRTHKFVPDQNSALKCNKNNKLHSPQSSSSATFVSRNRLAPLYRSIFKHGMNFKAVRSEYPHLEHLTSRDLYLMWRKMWQLP